MFSPNEKNSALDILYSSLNSIQDAIWLGKKQGYIHPSCKHRDLGAGNGVGGDLPLPLCALVLGFPAPVGDIAIDNQQHSVAFSSREC